MQDNEIREGVMYQVIADGIPWVDADGADAFDWLLTANLAADLESRGYVVEIREA